VERDVTKRRAADRPASCRPNNSFDVSWIGYDALQVVKQSSPVTEATSHSHSIVPGGLLVMSYVTRFTPRTSFTMRFATPVRNAMSNG
jgi:hypothetical protein